jgi:hypothetical protein
MEYGTHYNTHYRVDQPTIYSRLDQDESILQPVLLCVKLRFNIILSAHLIFPSSLFLLDTCNRSWHNTHTHARALNSFSLFSQIWTYIKFILDVGTPIQGHTVSMPRWPQSASCWLTLFRETNWFPWVYLQRNITIYVYLYRYKVEVHFFQIMFQYTVGFLRHACVICALVL